MFYPSSYMERKPIQEATGDLSAPGKMLISHSSHKKTGLYGHYTHIIGRSASGWATNSPAVLGSSVMLNPFHLLLGQSQSQSWWHHSFSSHCLPQGTTPWSLQEQTALMVRPHSAERPTWNISKGKPAGGREDSHAGLGFLQEPQWEPGNLLTQEQPQPAKCKPKYSTKPGQMSKILWFAIALLSSPQFYSAFMLCQ